MKALIRKLFFLRPRRQFNPLLRHYMMDFNGPPRVRQSESCDL